MQRLVSYTRLIDDLKHWIEEDMPYGDITSDSIFDETMMASGVVIVKEEGIICGLDLFGMVYNLMSERIPVHVELSVKDGDKVFVGDEIGKISGPIGTILKGERLILNLVQRLSGIATKTNRFVKEIEGLDLRIVDTRKTIPGLRYLEKYAVRVGGGFNHRQSLSDAVMIKDNHIAGAGGILEAVQKVKKIIPYTSKIEVEVETLSELKQAIEADIDIVMLDNMSLEELKKAVSIIRMSRKPNLMIEASGNITLNRLKEVALTGVDIISVGELTHSVKALDISLKFLK